MVSENSEDCHAFRSVVHSTPSNLVYTSISCSVNLSLLATATSYSPANSNPDLSVKDMKLLIDEAHAHNLKVVGLVDLVIKQVSKAFR